MRKKINSNTDDPQMTGQARDEEYEDEGKGQTWMGCTAVQANIRRRLSNLFIILLAVVIDSVNEMTNWILYADHLLVATPGE